MDKIDSAKVYNYPPVGISADVFAELVAAVLDSTMIDSNGVVSLHIAVSDIARLKKALNITAHDDSVTLSLLAAITAHLADNCAGGRCAGTVQQKIPK